MAAVEYILGFGVALFTVVFALFQCIRCRENDRKQSENTNNNEPQDKTHSCGPSEAGCEEAGKHNVRKLPDIPHNTTTGDGEVVENVDETVGSSEVYATVNDYPVRADLNEGRSIYAVNGPNHRGVSKHPYAILTGRHSSEEEEEENTDNDTYAVPHPQLYSKQTTSPKAWDGSTYEASPPVPEKRYEAGEPSTSDFNSQPSISAASAVAGRASAADIPLMTPMIQDNESEYNNSQASNGYSLISVREPLDRLIGDTQNSYTEVQEVESHYDIVPDDPDKMYTEITAQNYHSTENYSTIDLDMVYGNGIHPPAPPTVESLRSVAQAHSRQASLSSFVSDTEGAGASLPVNSKIEDMYSKIDKKKKSRSTIHVMVTGGSAAASSMSESDCGEMYAQIQKPRRKSASQPGVVSRYSFTTHSHHHHHPPPPETARKSDGISVVRRSSSKEDPGYEKIREYPRNSPVELSVESDNDYEVVAENRFRDYETLRSRQHRNSKDVDDDDKIEADPGYEKVHPNRDDAGGSDAGYEIVGEPSYFQRSDPNYESLKYATTTGGRSEPNYWHIQSKQSSETEDPLYEKINGDELGLKRADSDEGYETVSNIRTSSNTSNSSNNNNNNNSNGKVLSSASNTAYQSGSSDSASRNADEHLRTNDGGGSSVFDDSDSLL